MATPLDELKTRIDELKADAAFVALASQLRPRIGDVMNWAGPREVVDLARKFIDEKTSRPEGLYGPLLIRLLAAFERFLRNTVVHVLDQRRAGAKTYDELADGLGKRNIVLTGRVLASIDAPREHMVVDVTTLIDNLASCKAGSDSFRLNAQAFSATVTGTSPSVIEKALNHVDVDDFWDAVGGNAGLVKTLGTKGARATGDRARERLQELWRWRNHLAHGGDEDVVISESQLKDAVDFVGGFGDALSAAIGKQLARVK